MSRCDINPFQSNFNQEQRIKHWENVLINGLCQDCGLGKEIAEKKKICSAYECQEKGEYRDEDGNWICQEHQYKFNS